jgi:hypothetical protein
LNKEVENNIVILDLLPGGIEVVPNSISNHLDYADIREDRVVFFGTATANATEIVYRIKATNVGTYIVPPIYATSMYNPKVQGSGISKNISIINR